MDSSEDHTTTGKASPSREHPSCQVWLGSHMWVVTTVCCQPTQKSRSRWQYQAAVGLCGNRRSSVKVICHVCIRLCIQEDALGPATQQIRQQKMRMSAYVEYESRTPSQPLLQNTNGLSHIQIKHCSAPIPCSGQQLRVAQAMFL